MECDRNETRKGKKEKSKAKNRAGREKEKEKKRKSTVLDTRVDQKGKAVNPRRSSRGWLRRRW